MIAIVKLKMLFATLANTRMRIPLLCLFLAAGNFYCYLLFCSFYTTTIFFGCMEEDLFINYVRERNLLQMFADFFLQSSSFFDYFFIAFSKNKIKFACYNKYWSIWDWFPNFELKLHKHLWSVLMNILSWNTFWGFCLVYGWIVNWKFVEKVLEEFSDDKLKIV